MVFIKNVMTGIILSGGKSLRMGENKAFILIEGVPIIQRIFQLFHCLFQEVLIITNQKEVYQHINAKVYNDLQPNLGVLGGVYTGLYYATFPYAFVAACDMPYLKAPVIKYLIDHINGFDVVVPKTPDGLQPLHAVYSKNCLEPIKRVLDQSQTKVIDFYPYVQINIIEAMELQSLDPTLESFVNLNTPEELNHLIQKKAIS